MPLFKCPMCNVEFKAYDRKRIYCGTKCLAQSKRKVFTDKQICPTCKTEKDRKEFWVNNSKPSGLHYQCISCSKKQYIDKTTPEFIEKERNRCKRKRRRQLGIDPDFEGNYKSGPKKTGEPKNEYVYLHGINHPNCQKSNKTRICEHVYIMSQYLGRPLKKGENVHHKNGLRYDNRIENLELWTVKQPPGRRVDDKIKWCIEFLDEYGYDVTKR